ncbi:SDR family oxidoreductase [Nocardioides sp. zg-536]|uniref:SDR family oxidoreductase n=1 Tax=Nocardioides faecalis TaxID=2803858 RepID=A0A938YA29_9ACTN|nr:SDR family oxidoreductase [Nocardioides faecalis]MBM9460883.1 SDR family oxidoreductase [Nocardioides faecalis]QVI59289.1 SDR family oxidoreductase [Nocardioides faecalis]
MPKPVHPERRPAVVAGASSGIGAATARTLAAAGFPVALGARRVERLEELADAIRAEGGEAFVHALDVSSTSSVEKFATAAAEALGDVEVVVANAGLLAPGAIVEATTEQLAAEFDVNVLGAHRLVRAFAPGMLGRQRGDLVFVSSDTALRARPFMRGYSATKSGLEGLVEALQMELEGTGVRASIVRPGPTWSEMGGDWDADAGAKVLTEWVKWGHARHPHFLKPTAIAQAITTVVSAPRGVHISPVDVNPEAPIARPEKEQP